MPARPFPNPPQTTASLFVATTAANFNTQIINALVTLGLRADLWPVEEVLASIVFIFATLLAGLDAIRVAATKAGWLPTAVGGWLTWLALYMYGVTRDEATFASGSLTLTNSVGATYNFAPFTAQFGNSRSGAVYTNVTAISLAALGTQTISIQAIVQGSASNAAPGEISQLVTSMRGVTCTNVAPVLGTDEQSDDSLQLECWNSIAANSAYGPRQSFGYAVQTALNAVTQTPVNINRYGLSPSSHTGQVTVTLASPNGAADPNDVTGVANNIEAIARPMCVQVTTQGATVVPYGATLTAYVVSTPGLDAGTVQAAMAAALDTFFASPATSPIGGRVRPSDGFEGVFASGVEGTVQAAWPGTFDVEGAFDLAMTTGQVATNGCTVNVVLVPQ